MNVMKDVDESLFRYKRCERCFIKKDFPSGNRNEVSKVKRPKEREGRTVIHYENYNVSNMMKV